VYGTRGLLNSWDPLWANAQVYAGLAHDSWHARSWLDKLKVWTKPPGWRPADVAERFPKPAFSIVAAARMAGLREEIRLLPFACVSFVDRMVEGCRDLMRIRPPKQRQRDSSAPTLARPEEAT
jgi:hypothetical protein